jgi:hypothetical protein
VQGGHHDTHFNFSIEVLLGLLGVGFIGWVEREANKKQETDNNDWHQPPGRG